LSVAAKELTILESRRVKTARILLALMLAFLVFLAAWQWVESHKIERSLPGIAGEYDPLSIDQDGIELVRMNEEGSILWYQSNWSVAQSQVLVIRALTLEGWQCVSEEHEQVLSFVYPSDPASAGGFVLVTFHTTDEGCSILICR